MRQAIIPLFDVVRDDENRVDVRRFLEYVESRSRINNRAPAASSVQRTPISHGVPFLSLASPMATPGQEQEQKQKQKQEQEQKIVIPTKSVPFTPPPSQSQTQAPQVRTPQKELVFIKRQQLQVLYGRFDQGQIGLTKFREEILKLGFRETASLRSLFQHHPMQFRFHDFLSALGDADDIERAEYEPQPANKPSMAPPTELSKETPNAENDSFAVRQQVYSCIRDLDMGIIGASGFEQRIRQGLGMCLFPFEKIKLTKN
jgi:hypothetical protein